MVVSVLISTYNGEKYIVEQLDSLFTQTRSPNEVVIIDDFSTDNTLNLIQQFVKEKGLEDSWKIFRNDRNLGWRTNFIRGLSKISGDYLFYCDQDDIWFDNKIEEYCNVLDNEKSINVIASQETPWSSNDIRPKCHIEKSSLISMDLALNSDKYLIHSSGCCMAIRLDYIKNVIRYYCDGWAHDDFFWKMSILDGSLGYMNTSTILHRITGINESRKKTNLQMMKWTNMLDINIAKKLIERLNVESERIINKGIKKAILQHKLDGSILRKRMIDSKNPLDAIKLYFQYSDIYRKKKQIIGDYLRTVGFIK